MTITVTKEQLSDFIGKQTGESDWIQLDQEAINAFADITHDHQFIHVDPDAARKTPFGGTIAHGFFVLSLLPKFQQQCGLQIEGAKMGVNYGFEKIRFLSPVSTGSKVRGRSILASAAEKKPGQLLLTYDVTVDIDGLESPALIAQWLVMVFV